MSETVEHDRFDLTHSLIEGVQGCAILLLDANGNVATWNASAQLFKGYRAEEIIGRHFSVFYPSGDVAAGKPERELATAAAVGHFEDEGWRVRQDGTQFWANVVITALRDAEGTLRGYGKITRDLTASRTAEIELRAALLQVSEQLDARKRAEAALRDSEALMQQIENNSRLGLALIAGDGVFARVNPAFCELTDYSRAVLLTMDLAAIFHPDDLKDLTARNEYLASGAAPSYNMEARVLRPDGYAFWTNIHASAVRNTSGEVTYFILQLHEINTRKAAEEAVKIAHKSALAATLAKSSFLATMSHEIRTPMNGIIGMAELLSLSPSLSDEQNEYVSVIRNSGRALMRILNDILDYSKIEAGKLELEVVDFDVRAEVASIVLLLEAASAKKGIVVETDIDEAFPNMLNGDPERLRQILVNLIGNAIKFTPPGGSVRIRTKVQPGEKGAILPVHFAIEDTGLGIPREVRHRLFMPFSQVDGTTTRKFGGTGLGLSICKQLVELMGGTIGVNSEPGFGSTFWFTVLFRPISKTESDQQTTVEPMVERGLQQIHKPAKILVAEDNDINALVVTKQFAKLGYDVVVMPDGREAVNAVMKERFDIVFMDCHMPIMDGFEATKAIRSLTSERRPGIPIVAMTANAQVGDQETCLAAGMDDYISKPLSLADLHRVLERWLLAEPAASIDRIA